LICRKARCAEVKDKGETEMSFLKNLTKVGRRRNLGGYIWRRSAQASFPYSDLLVPAAYALVESLKDAQKAYDHAGGTGAARLARYNATYAAHEALRKTFEDVFHKAIQDITK
jgi:hypothetical protein